MVGHFLLYGHGGSYNHGGEALARTTISLLRRMSPECRITLSTHFAEQDRQFKIDADEFVERNINGHTNEEIYAPTLEVVTPGSVCIHLGGDNYCYRNWQRYAQIHYKAIECGAKSILWSCSIEPEAIDEEMLTALKSHHLVTARETITYNALVERGLSNVVKVSDIAFTLKAEPIEFNLPNFVALNLSPLVTRKNPFVIVAVQKLIDYILNETDMNIALVPHVVNPVDNDGDVLHPFETSNPERIVYISDNLSAEQYKYIISKARLGVFARTHAAIAAYSSLVPSLAIGYSSKSLGIASDLGMADYVINVEQISNEQYLKDAFIKLKSDEMRIRGMLAEQMPEYVLNSLNEHALEFLEINRRT